MTSRRGNRRAVRHALSWLVAWFALFWLWMLLVGEWNHQEWIAAAAAATAAATLGEIARTRARVRLRVPVRWVARAWTVPIAIVVDFGIVMWALVRRREGTWVRRPLPEGAPNALIALLATYSPNAYVVDVDEEAGIVVLHDLVRHRPSESPV
jgi:multisubunit Na+/H+ antiporter MnhE subunit